MVDYNPTVSDVPALLFLVEHPDIRVIAVTIPGTGESHCEHAVPNTRSLLSLVGAGGIPVACGREDPLTGFNAFPTSWRVAADELAGINLPPVTPTDQGPAPALLAQVISDEPGPVTLLTLGPLTNIAEAVEQFPQFLEKVEAIYVMGGAVDVPGNVIRNEVAEWNIWVDPHAANVVLGAGVPVTLVPLDATNYVPTTRIYYRALSEHHITPAAQAVFDLFTAHPETYESGSFYLWDELAAAVMVDITYAKFETRRLTVIEEGRDQMGRTIEAPDGVEVRVATWADRDRFERDLISVLNHGIDVQVRVEATPELEAYFKVVEAIVHESDDRFDAEMERLFSGFSDVGEEPSLEQLQDLYLGLFSVGLAFASEQADALEAVNVPSEAEAAHVGFIDSLRALEASIPDAVDRVLQASSADELDLLFADSELVTAIEATESACFDLQTVGELHSLDVDLRCSR